MKSFQYKAKNRDGQILEGVIETQHFAEATSMIQARGLELISLEELKTQFQETTPYIFDAIDREGEPVQGTIQGTDEDVVKQKLEEEFGYLVSKVYRKTEPELHSEQAPETVRQQQTPETTPESHTSSEPSTSSATEEGIIFQSAPKIIHSKPLIPEEELNEVHETIQLLLTEKGAAIQPITRDRLLHLDGMIELIRESQNKQRWKTLKKEIRNTQKIAEREIRHYEDEKWKTYEQKNPAPAIPSYADFPQKVSRLMKKDGYVAKVMNWLQTVDTPNEQMESEVLVKQQYESIWTELQRFSGALMGFYLLFFFSSYYLKRSGVDDSLLIRIYDTTLFKQLVLGLFLAYGVLTIRKEYLRKRLKVDIVLVAFAAALVLFIW